MANAAALIYETLPDLNWAGFYRNVGGELVLGPFQGRAACIRIPFGKGVCGAAAATLQVQRVDDVHAFPGHIACDAASASELVVPIVRDGELLAVLDLDSPKVARFDAEDEAGCVRLGEILPSDLDPQPVRVERSRDTRALRLRSGRTVSASSSCSSCSSLSDPGMIITMHGNLPASAPVKLVTTGPGLPAGAAPSTSAAMSLRVPM